MDTENSKPGVLSIFNDRNKLFLVFVFAVGLVVRTNHLLQPINTGSWRESDISSIARNYERHGMNFLYPEIDWAGKSPSYAEMEFPVYPYLIAISHKLFGYYEPTGRIISFIFSLLTLLVFIKLSRLILPKMAANISSAIFSISPINLFAAVAVQSESIMFFFYVWAVYLFYKWLQKDTLKLFIWSIIALAMAILSKATSIHLGLFFILLLFRKYKFDAFKKVKIWMFALLSLLPGFLWYYHAKLFYLEYGNSLGVSNEHHWIGIEFFKNYHILLNIININIYYVWSKAGLLLLVIGLIAAGKYYLKEFVLPMFWGISVYLYYIIISRTSGSDWSFYYHIFSIPYMSLLYGLALYMIYKKFISGAVTFLKENSTLLKLFKPAIIIIVCGLIILQLYQLYKPYYSISNHYLAKSEYYECIKKFNAQIPKNEMVLVTGGTCYDLEDRHQVAYNVSFPFYWMDRKGYNICIQEQDTVTINSYKKQGIHYFLYQHHDLFKDLDGPIEKNYSLLDTCKSYRLYKL